MLSSTPPHHRHSPCCLSSFPPKSSWPLRTNMAAAADLAVMPQSSRLLNIPDSNTPPTTHNLCLQLTLCSEIRGRIFEMAIDDMTFEPPSTFLWPRRNHEGLLLPKRILTIWLYLTDPHTRAIEPSWWRRLRRSYLGLTQTCRQLRKEFLPIHQSHIYVTIVLRHLNHYALAFICTTDFANVFVEIPTGITELRDVILLCDKAPTIQIEFRVSSLHGLDRIFLNPYDHPSFFTYVETRVARVDAVTRGHEMYVPRWYNSVIQVILHVKPDFAEKWMQTPEAAEHRHKLQRWRREIGVGNLHFWPFGRPLDIRKSWRFEAPMDDSEFWPVSLPLETQRKKRRWVSKTLTVE